MLRYAELFKRAARIAALSFALPAFAAAPPVLFQSTFDTSTEGWSAFVSTTGNPTQAIQWVSNAGNPGGAIRTLSPSDNETSFFRGPTSLVNALHGAVGGNIAWDISTTRQPADDFFSSNADIQVRAGDDRIRRSLALSAPTHPNYVTYKLDFSTTDQWSFFDGVNTTIATQQQIDNVLTNATSFIVRAEFWSSNTSDAGYLDNVILTAVPEPGEWALLLAGLGFVGCVARARRRLSRGPSH